MNLSKTEWADNVRNEKFKNFLCVSCHKERAVEVIATSVDYKNPGILETALCLTCYNNLVRVIDA